MKAMENLTLPTSALVWPESHENARRDTGVVSSDASRLLRLKRTQKKLSEFGQLPEGWYAGKGGPIEASLLAIACDVLKAGHEIGFPKFDAFPGAAGEVLVTFYEKRHCVEALIERDQDILLTHEAPAKEDVETPCAGLAEARIQLAKIRGSIWQNSLESFRQSTLTPKSVVSAISPSSDRLAEIWESQLSISTAPSENLEAFAFTSSSFIPTSKAPSFFGNLMRGLFRTETPRFVPHPDPMTIPATATLRIFPTTGPRSTSRPSKVQTAKIFSVPQSSKFVRMAKAASSQRMI